MPARTKGLAARVASLATSLLLSSLALLGAGCGDRSGTALPASFSYDVPLDPGSPWPKFRRNSAQDGRSSIGIEAARSAATAESDTRRRWVFATGKGIFSSPVIRGDGSVLIGSADRRFYSLSADGASQWSLLTGEIIDSSALLDERGRVYFGSGDGRLYARDAATGAEVWTFTADPPATTGSFIDWFEGNVAIGPDGTLYAPNDNFLTYAIDRDTVTPRWKFRTVDQTWSLPAVDAATGRLFLGNNNLLKLLGPNTFSIDGASGEAVWSSATDGTIAASPAIDRAGRMFVGGFDGFLRAYDQATGELLWSFGARDHIYASPALQPDGTVVQPAADGSVYGLDPASGAIRWQFDTLDAIRSSPAVDAEGHVYVGSGEGRLFVLEPDGRLRWSIRLIDAERDDLNASPALGREAIVVAGESGEIFSLPWDYCLTALAEDDARCRLGPAEDLPPDGIELYFTTQFGKQRIEAPRSIAANQPLTFSLFVREGGDTILAHLDSSALRVTLDPPVDARVEVSGDRKFVTIIPDERLAGPAGGRLAVTLDGQILVDPDRVGLQFSGGRPGGTFSRRFEFAVEPADAGAPFPYAIPAAPGAPSGLLELSRLAAPLPTILPSYNQIGFDSIHYLIGIVEGDAATGRAVAWLAGARLAEGENRTVIDPASRVLAPFEIDSTDGLLTLTNRDGFAIEFNGVRIPFELFRVATRVDRDGHVLASPAINTLAVCAGITFYGPFLQQLGFCNPQTDILDVFGGGQLQTFAGGVQNAPGGVGAVAFTATSRDVTATLTGSQLRADRQSVAILLVDADTGRPVSLDYGFTVERTTTSAGTLTAVRQPFSRDRLPRRVRAYLMVDTYPAALDTLDVP